MLLLFLNAGVELLRPFEFGLQGAPTRARRRSCRQQLLFGEGALAGSAPPAGCWDQPGQRLSRCCTSRVRRASSVVIGAGHLACSGGRTSCPPGARRGPLRRGQGRPPPTGLQLGGDAAAEIARPASAAAKLLLVLEAGGEAQLLGSPSARGSPVHQATSPSRWLMAASACCSSRARLMGLDGDGE